jgi:hypothetical protein
MSYKTKRGGGTIQWLKGLGSQGGWPFIKFVLENDTVTLKVMGDTATFSADDVVVTRRHQSYEMGGRAPNRDRLRFEGHFRSNKERRVSYVEFDPKPSEYDAVVQALQSAGFRFV